MVGQRWSTERIQEAKSKMSFDTEHQDEVYNCPNLDPADSSEFKIVTQGKTRIERKFGVFAFRRTDGCLGEAKVLDPAEAGLDAPKNVCLRPSAGGASQEKLKERRAKSRIVVHNSKLSRKE